MNDNVGKICCGSCMFLQLRQKNGSGQCFRYPPSIVVMHEQQPDVMRGAREIVQRLVAVRPTMQENEGCGEFRSMPPVLN